MKLSPIFVKKYKSLQEVNACLNWFGELFGSNRKVLE